jgi:hypothetical protein
MISDDGYSSAFAPLLRALMFGGAMAGIGLALTFGAPAGHGSAQATLDTSSRAATDSMPQAARPRLRLSFQHIGVEDGQAYIQYDVVMPKRTDIERPAQLSAPTIRGTVVGTLVQR